MAGKSGTSPLFVALVLIAVVAFVGSIWYAAKSADDTVKENEGAGYRAFHAVMNGSQDRLDAQRERIERLRKEISDLKRR